MSKKLLEESTIRSFMKLANLKPLSEKFISEKYGMKEEEKEEESEEEKEEESEEEEESEDKKKKVDESAPPADVERSPETGMQEELDEEIVEEEAEPVEEGKESEGRPASPKQKVAGVAKPGKMAAAKNAAGDAKLKPAQKSSHHSDKPDTIETKGHSNAPKKNNSQFEIVSESLEEEMDEADAEGTPSDAAGEGGDHQAKMKDLIRGMLNTLKDMGAEYGMTMEVSDEGASGDEEMTPPAPEGGEEDEGMMQEKLDEMVEKLTKRVAARLVKESKKKR